MTLEEFLNLDLKPVYKIVHLPRLHLDFKIRAITTNELQEAYQQAEIAQRGNPNNKFLSSYYMLLTGIVEPNLLDERILRKANVATPEDFLGVFLLPGELTQLITAFNELNQLNQLNNKLVADAKN